MITLVYLPNLETDLKTSSYYNTLPAVYLHGSNFYFFGIFFAWLGWVCTSSPERKSLASVLFIVNSIGLITHHLQAFGKASFYRDINGHPIFIPQYLDRIMTTPSLLSLMSMTTKSNFGRQWLISSNTIFIGFEFLGSILKSPFDMYSRLFTIPHSIAVIAGMWVMFTEAIQGKTGSKLRKSFLKWCRFICIAAWLIFPILQWLKYHRFLSFILAEALIVISDGMMKVLMTVALINAAVESSQNEKIDALIRINKLMEIQKENFEILLQSKLPYDILKQLRNGEATPPVEYDRATIFLSDITEFTSLSAKTSTKDMLTTLRNLWIEYDSLAKQYGIYKVETIGDAYLGVTGCPTQAKSDNAATDAVNFALDIVDMVNKFRTVNGEKIQVRIGLHTGPITAGILSELNPHWCIAGQTVKTASQMESGSEAMRIRVSDATYDQIKDKDFVFSEPEVMQLRDGNKLLTYWVLGRK